MEKTLGRIDGAGPFAPPEREGATSAALHVETARSSTRAGAGSWVESSWELRRGLVVSEGLPADVALDEWLDAMTRR